MPSSRIVSPNLELAPESNQQPPSAYLKSELDFAKAELSLVKEGQFVSLPLWDFPLRLFHWSLVIAVLVAIVSAKVGGEWMALHGKAGLSILGLLSFRLVWGLIGTRYARFANFFPTVSNIRLYLQGRWQRRGHNPLGAVSVLLLLTILLLQAVGGLFTDDEISFTGPLAHLLDAEVAVKLTGWHHQLSNALIAFLLLHVLAIVFYHVFKKKNLVTPMITGQERVPVGQAEQAEQAEQTQSQQAVNGWALILSIAVAASNTYAASIGFGTHASQTPIGSAGDTSSSAKSAGKQVAPLPEAAPAPTW